VKLGKNFAALTPFILVARDNRPTTTRHIAELGHGGVALTLCRRIIPSPVTFVEEQTLGKTGCHDCQLLAKPGLHCTRAWTPKTG
jgi:hypothetical protein